MPCQIVRCRAIVMSIASGLIATRKGELKMEHHHISSDRVGLKCIDIYLNHEAGEVQILDNLDASNKIAISASDWNELVSRIRAGQIGKVHQ